MVCIFMRSHFTVYPIWKLSDDVAIIVICPHIQSFIKMKLHSCQIGRKVRLHVLVVCKITENHQQYIHLSLWILGVELNWYRDVLSRLHVKYKWSPYYGCKLYPNTMYVILSVFFSPLYCLSLFYVQVLITLFDIF